MLNKLNIFLPSILAMLAITVAAESKYPVNLKFEPISTCEVSMLLNSHDVPEIIVSSWKTTNETYLSKPPTGMIAKYDLNDDDIEEIFLYLSGQNMCGTGGCHLIIFQFNTNNQILEYRTVRSSSDDILILNSLSNDGYRDIAIRLMAGTNISKAQAYTVYEWKNGDLKQIDKTTLFQQSNNGD
ncbi:MAG: hypothetical protein DYH15_01040 [Nitrosomonas sp. PRO4]|nr:hypothetical protein [Nitrosomonas sp. PRO4]